MGDIFGAIGDSINQDKGFLFGLANNAISYAQSKKAQKRAYQYALALQQQQYNLTQQGYREGPSNQRKGLEDAGYNPMLALGNVGSATNVAGGTPVNANAVDSPNLTGTALDLQRLANETEQTNSNVEVNNASSFKTKMEGIAQMLKNPFVSDKEKAELNKIGSETTKLNTESEYFSALKQNLADRLELDRFLGIRGQDKSYNASTYHSNTLKEISDAHSPSGSSVSFRNYTSGVSDVLNGIGSIFHGYNESNNYNGSNEYETVYYDKNGKVRGSVSHKGSNKGNSHKSRKRR